MEPVPPASTSTPTAPAPSPWKNEKILLILNDPSKDEGDKKRKRSSSSSAVSLKKPKTIIDCQKAIAFFSELGLHRSFLNSGMVLAWNLEPNDPNYLNIQTYVNHGQYPYFDCQLFQVLRVMARVDGLQDDGTLSDFNDDPHTKSQLRKMLWHGTSAKNVAKILQNGLQLPKRKLSQWFGDGIYFSDYFSMSICYCCDWRNGASQWEKDKDGSPVAFLFLCEVLLENLHKTFKLEPTAPKIAVSKPGAWFWEKKEIKKFDSIQGCGIWTVDPQGDKEISGCIWPLGSQKRLVLNEEAPYNCPNWANMYVVYETKRVIPKYLVKVKIPTS